MGTTYKIKQGDTLSSIAKQHGTSVNELASANGISNPNLIIAGKNLTIPSSNVATQVALTGGGGSSSKGTQNAGYTYTPFEYDDFNWVNQDKLDDYVSKYETRDPFSYDFNTDALYQQYKDKYIKQAKMASADVMGQAAAMNGGYGSSYAQTVGNQAYQANLEQLNDVIPELYQLAYDKYNQQGQDMLDMISLLRGEREFDYGQYSTDRNLAMTEHTNSESYKYGAYRDSVEDEQWQKTYEEGKRQYDEQMAFQKQQYEDSKFVNAGGSYKASVDKSGNKVVTPVVDEDAKKLDISKIPGINTTDTSWFDSNGNFKKAEYLGETSDGKASFRIDGKTVTYEVGVNPYTQTKNPDVKKGAFSNGYQPNNVGGKKLSKSGIQDYMNGVLQTVWQTKDGKLWIWDGTQNKYLEYQK